ncbi:hypothetical protein, partial [Pseudoalteromonas undina]
ALRATQRKHPYRLVTSPGTLLRFSVVKQSLYTPVKALLLKRQQAARLQGSLSSAVKASYGRDFISRL